MDRQLNEVKLDPEKNTRLKAEKKEGGTTWLNGETGRVPNLITKEAFGDCEIHVEFMIAKNSNAGVKFHEVYEIQILDSLRQERHRRHRQWAASTRVRTP